MFQLCSEYVSVLGPALTASGRHFARALSYWRLEKDDDAAFETYASLARGELVEAPCEPPRGGAAASFGSSTLAAARLAARLLRERCREDLRGGARPDDEAAARWTRRHIGWILREAPEEGVAALATPRVARAIDFQFVAEACVSANATRATRARVLLDRVRPFAPDRANGDAHTAAAVALWEAAEEETLRAETGASTDAADRKSWFDAARFLASLRQEPRRVDARAALAALDPNAVTSSSVRGTLALGLVTGVRVAPPAIRRRWRGTRRRWPSSARRWATTSPRTVCSRRWPATRPPRTRTWRGSGMTRDARATECWSSRTGRRAARTRSRASRSGGSFRFTRRAEDLGFTVRIHNS